MPLHGGLGEMWNGSVGNSYRVFDPFRERAQAGAEHDGYSRRDCDALADRGGCFFRLGKDVFFQWLPFVPKTAPKRSAVDCAGCPRFAPAYPVFLLRSTRQNRVCGFLQGKPHAGRQRHQPRQEIRGTWDDNGLFPMLSQKGATALNSVSQAQKSRGGAPLRYSARLTQQNTDDGRRHQVGHRSGEHRPQSQAGEVVAPVRRQRSDAANLHADGAKVGEAA